MTDGALRFAIALLPYIVGAWWVNRKDNRYFKYFVLLVLVFWGQAVDMALEADIGDMEIALILAMAALGSFVAAYIIHEHAVRKDQESAPRTESLWGYVVRSFRQLTHVEAMSLAATVLLLVSYVGNRYLDAISNVS